jgi:thiosulfate/3-mercaptopyruvate sulfurtransferase
MNTFFKQQACGLLLSVATWAAQAGVLPGPLVDTQWLAANADKVQIVEVRGNAKSFTTQPEISTDAKGKKTIEEIGGHIPGSVLVDAKKMRTDRKYGDLTVKYMIPEAADFEKYVRSSGVVSGKPIVLVPVGAEVADINDALRMYWQFKVYGEDDMAVLDGGYTAWLLEGRAVSKDAPAGNGSWSVKADRSARYFASSEDVARAVQTRSATLVDSRDGPLYHGLVKRDYVYAPGHIEGAKLYPTELMFKNSAGMLKFMAPATYKGLLSAQGIDDKAAAIAYCNSGHLASGPWFLMSEVLGNSQVRLYDGSLHQWTLEKRPLAGAVPLQ